MTSEHHAYAFSILAAMVALLTACATPQPQQDSAKEIRIAELKGQRAGVAKEIELQNDAISDLQARIDSGEDKIPGVRIIGKSADAVKQDKIRDRLITLQSQLAQIDGEINALSPAPSTAP
jgi:hypothetical protein